MTAKKHANKGNRKATPPGSSPKRAAQDPPVAPNRDPNPRAPIDPDPHVERGPQEIGGGTAMAMAPVGPVAPPPVRWIGTNFNYDVGHDGIVGIVIHTEVGTNAGATARFQQPNQASAHYGVAYDGHEVVQWVAESNTAWHCGRYYPAAGFPIANRTAIGIEHEDDGQYNSPRPDGLYETSARLVAWICERYGIPCDRAHIRKHNEVSIVGTGCPDSLDIDRIVARAAQILTPPIPTWQASFHAEAYSVTLPAAVPLYDMTTGVPAGTIAAGPFTSAYRGTFKGVDYRVTQYSFDHGTPKGVKASDVVVKPPDPEWLKNSKAVHRTATLATSIPLIDLVTGANAGTIPVGPLTTDYDTTVTLAGAQVECRMTSYSFNRSIPHGARVTDIMAAAPIDPPKPPDPKPPDPQPPTDPTKPGFAEAFLRWLLQFLKKIFP